MHPYVAQKLVEAKMADALAEAQRERLIQAARSRGPRPIDAVGLRERLVRLFGGRDVPVGAGRTGLAGA
jgi:hypothetical protein